MRGFGPARRGEEDCGVSPPHDEVLLFRQKNPKPVAPGRGPKGVPVPRSLLLGLRNSLRSDSPRRHMAWTGPGRSPARRRQDNGICLFCHARLDRASRVLGLHAGFRPRTTRSFCFGKRTQNHWRPGVALRVPLPRSLLLGLRNSLRSDSPRLHNGRDGTGAQPRPQAPGQRQRTTTLDPRVRKDDREKRRDDGEKRKDDRPFCHARLDRASSLLSCPAPIGHPGAWGGRYLERRGTTRRSSPTGSWCLCVGAGLGARPSFLFSCGVSAPHDEVLLFRQKDPKPLAPGRGPSGAFAPVPVAWAAELASLRQSSPQIRIIGTGAQPRPQAPRQRHLSLLSCPARSGIQCLCCCLFCEE